MTEENTVPTMLKELQVICDVFEPFAAGTHKSIIQQMCAVCKKSMTYIDEQNSEIAGLEEEIKDLNRELIRALR